MGIAWVVLSLPISIITWTLALVWITGPIAALVSPFLGLIDYLLGTDVFNAYGLGVLWDDTYPPVFASGILMGAGILLLLTLPFVMRSCRSVLVAFSDMMLSKHWRQRSPQPMQQAYRPEE